MRWRVALELSVLCLGYAVVVILLHPDPDLVIFGILTLVAVPLLVHAVSRPDKRMAGSTSYPALRFGDGRWRSGLVIVRPGDDPRMYWAARRSRWQGGYGPTQEVRPASDSQRDALLPPAPDGYRSFACKVERVAAALAASEEALPVVTTALAGWEDRHRAAGA